MYKTILTGALVFFLQVNFLEGIHFCQKPEDVSNTSVVDCISGFDATVCLICPASMESDALQWNKDNETRPIFRDKYSTNEQYRSLSVNECDEELYSLKIPHVDVVKTSGKYMCQQQGITRATFLVKIQVVPVMSLIHNTMTETRKITTRVGNRETLQCTVSQVLPPITLLWNINGIDQKKEEFSGSATGLRDFVSTIEFTSSSSFEEISCFCTGQYVRDGKVAAEIVIETITTQTSVTTESTSMDVSSVLSVVAIAAPLMIITVLGSAIITCRKQRRNGRKRMNQRIPLPDLPFPDIPIYESPVDKGDVVYFYGESVVYHRSDVKLKESLPGSGRMQRWMAHLEKKSSEGPVFIASTLRDDATRDDWCELRLFAEYLKNVPKHENVVKVIGCDTNKIPHYIYTEFIKKGSLKDFLHKFPEENPYSQSIYGQQDGTSLTPENLKQLAKFSLDVIKGMIFLDSIDCDHPAICASKVLLKEDETCKLYDFHACSTTKKLLSAVDYETSPQLQWYAPETLCKQQYNRASDSWSIAVFILEVFSLGTCPFKVSGFQEMKSQLKIVPPLTQPKQCPDKIFEAMLPCLQIEPESRPSLNTIQKNIMEFVEGKEVEIDELDDYSRYI